MKNEHDTAAETLMLLGRVVDMGFAVALRRSATGIHARAVREGRVSESDRQTIGEVVEEIHRKVKRKKSKVASGT